ncbi:hypothetical protein ST47_g1559 [Ascochyta rabiei]|uniref:Uncharacterized protein n=1 Tax=Didymella rabiei TaxID=5454 RepID=A0A163KW98_DIDRA|nr:hypothetical protein ST47_g1559 [Ascochyta rabiei]
MVQASASVTTANRQKALVIVMEGYPSHWNRTRSGEEIRHKTKFEKDEGFSSCLGWLPSYITTCFTGSISDTPATRLPSSSENVAVKYTPPQAAQNRSILRPGSDGNYMCTKPHKVETPPAIPIAHYKLGDSEDITVDQASTSRNNIVDFQTPTALTRRFASSNKTLVEAFQLDHSGQYVAYEWTLQTAEAADAILPNKIDAVLSMESLYTTNKGVCSWRVLVLTQCDTVRLLQTLHAYEESDVSSNDSNTSVYSGKDWLKVETLVRSIASDRRSKDTKKVLRSLHHISIQNQLLYDEVQELKSSLKQKKKRSKKSHALPLQQHQEYHGGAVMWSPTAKKLVEEKEKEEKRVAREVAKEAREKEKANAAIQKAKQEAKKQR